MLVIIAISECEFTCPLLTRFHSTEPERGHEMADKNVTELSDENFENEIVKSDTVALVDFWAEWCGPCKAIGPTVEALAGEYAGKLKVGKMNIDNHQLVPQQYNVRSIPTLLFFKGGQVVGQIVGAVPKSKLVEEINKHV